MENPQRLSFEPFVGDNNYRIPYKYSAFPCAMDAPFQM